MGLEARLELAPDAGPDAGPDPESMTGAEACDAVRLVCGDAACPWRGARRCDRELVTWCAAEARRWAERACTAYDGAQCGADQGCPVEGPGGWPGLWDVPCEPACEW